MFKNRLKKTEQEWLQSRNKATRFEFSATQKRALKRWFDSMDVKQTGSVTVDELTDALLSTGERSTSIGPTTRTQAIAFPNPST